jgi:hypothetical protein
MRVDIIKNIPTVKIRRDSYYSGRNQMMIGCHEDYCDILLFELRKAKRNDGYCTCVELGYTSPIDRLNEYERRPTMLIDTNGFEIGDEVWYVDKLASLSSIKYGLFKTVVCGFEVYKDEIYIILDENDGLYDTMKISECYSNRKQAIDYCNRLNGVTI